MDPYDSFPQLNTFLGAVLNEDWREEFPSWSDALGTWLEASPSEAIAQFIAEIDRLVGTGHMDAVLEALCVGLTPAGDLAMTNAEWLELLRSRASRTIMARA